MHYYQFNIADYRKDASHLTPVEHHIYRWLIDEYYLQESPIPNNVPYLLRKMRLKNKHRESVEQILFEFFTAACDEDYKPVDLQIHTEYVQLGDYPEICQYWVHDRIESEIGEYKEFIEKKSAAGKASAKARASKTNTSTTNGNTCSTPVQLTTNHKPLTTNHKPDKDIAGVKTSSKSSPCPYQQIVDLYHEKLPMLPKVVSISDARKRSIKARWNNGAGDMEFWNDYFGHVAQSRFLTGRVDPPPGRKQFIADIDFLIRESTIIKTQEGKYHE
jgi:uncharacterized protein YdaU (DUF1376 family)